MSERFHYQNHQMIEDNKLVIDNKLISYYDFETC